jgi:hypothetical protein
MEKASAQTGDQARQDQKAFISLRGIAIGCLMSVVIAFGAPYGRQVIQGTSLALTSATPAAFFLLFVLLLTIHVLLSLCRRRWGFKRGELLTIFFMMMVSSAIPTKGVVGLLLPMITGTYYYATPENNWANTVHPNLPTWLLVEDAQAVKEFYEGGPRDGAVPWGSWLPPLSAWLLFYAAFYLTQTSIMVVMRRQWVEHERLSYPLMQVPLAMIQDDGMERLVNPFFRNWIMWLGFLIPFVLMSIYALSNYFPMFPALRFNAPVDILGKTVQLTFGINFLMMGFAFFINANVAFSLWFFYLLHKIQEGVMLHLGMETVQAELGWWTEPGMGHQMMGALISLMIASLWVARPHLKNVLRKAWRPDAPIDDSNEIMSYRSAILGILVGTGIMWGWLWKTGIPFWIVPVFLFAGLTIFTSLARIIAETGLPIIKATMIPAGFALSNVGVPALGIKGIIATGYTMIWCGDLLVFMMAPLANGLRLSSDTRGNRRRLFWAVAAVMLITLVLSVWYTIDLAYRHGSMNLLISDHYATEPSRLATEKILNPTGPSLSGYLRMSAGALFMGGLIIMRQQFLWWPFHPLGFVVSHGSVMDGIWFTIFLAWLFKAAILKYGGVRIYRNVQPFFLGMALGHIVVGGVWLVIDGFTGMVGNRIHLYS